VTRNGFGTTESFSAHLSHKGRILDAGCGNGRVTALLRKLTNTSKTQIVGIDFVSADVAAENLASEQNIEIRQKDLLGDLTDLGVFDFIYCQEVLHHTADPRRAFLNLSKQLSSNGEMAIYVYKTKAPVREF